MAWLIVVAYVVVALIDDYDHPKLMKKFQDAVV